nr:hypothetical protein [Erythrotrichia longistipitata]
MSILTNLLILLFPNLFGRFLLVSLNSLREYPHSSPSPAEFTFLSINKTSQFPREKTFDLEAESFSQKDIETFTRYERFCYLRELVNFVARYRTNADRFVQENWEDQLVISAGNDPISDVFNLDTIPMSRREIFPEQFKGIAHDLHTGRLLFGPSLASHMFEDLTLNKQLSSSTIYSELVGGNYYKYKKNVNIPFIERWNLFKKNRRTPNWPSANHKLLMKSLKFTPTFIPANNFYHPILSIPSGDYLTNALDKIHYFIFDWFVWESDLLSLPIKKGFVFFSPKDADEYINSAREQSPRIAKRYAPLQTFPINLALAYKWNRTSPPRLQFRFVPDIKEIGDLVYKYQYKKNIEIHPSQYITRYKFKGVPIYMTKPLIVQDEGKKITVDLGYNTSLNTRDKYMIFTSLDSLYKTWENFCSQYPKLRLPNKPVVQVYNLEDYLSDCETLLTSQCQNFRIVPSLEAYNLTVQKGHQNKNSIISYYYNYKLMPAAKRLSLWSKYFFWSLTTSRRPEW